MSFVKETESLLERGSTLQRVDEGLQISFL